MTYEYEIIDEGPHKGETIEVAQSIKDKPFTTLTIDGETFNVRRVIAGPGAFILKGDCWARSNYERGLQSPMSKEDRANLGKKL